MVRTIPLLLLVLFSQVALGQPAQWRPPMAPPTDGPLTSVRAASRALAAKDLSAIVRLMPPTWVADVDAIVQTRVKAMDPELFRRLVKVLKDLVGELQKRKGSLTIDKAQRGLYSKAEVDELVGLLISLWHTLDEAGLTHRDGWLRFSLAQFASHAGPRLLELLLTSVGQEQKTQVERALKTLSNATFARVSSRQDDTLGEVVTIKVTLDGESIADDLVQVGGQWVTLQMAGDFPAWVKEMKSGHRAWAKDQSQGRSERLAKVAELERAVEEFKETGQVMTVLELLKGR